MNSEAAKAHSEFGGSSASRWMNCPGSVALARTVPPAPSSVYADEGTRAHSVAEYCLVNQIWNTRDLLVIPGAIKAQQEGSLPELTNEIMDAVQLYLDEIHSDMQDAEDSVLLVEERFTLKLSTIEDGEVFGRNDAMLYSKSKRRLITYDYKHGVGVSVAAENNAQALFYATGALLSHDDWPIEFVTIKIVQPRAFDGMENGAVREWSCSPLDIFEFYSNVEQAISTAKTAAEQFESQNVDEDAWVNKYLASGKWCRFCPAAPACTLTERQFFEAAMLDLKSVADVEKAIVLPEPRSLSPEQLGRILQGGDLLVSWLGMVREYAENQILAGVYVPGYKAVEKEARRKWIDDQEEITGYLMIQFGLNEDEVRPRKLRTITEIERAIAAKYADKDAKRDAKNDFSIACTVKDSSGLTVVAESDKRPAVNAASRDFAGITV